MRNTTDIHPDVVFNAMLTTASHPTKIRNLTLVHQVCRERHELGSQDFSLKAVSAVVAERGGPKVKAMWNATSVDYRKVIETWEAFAGGGKTLREAQHVRPEDALTRSIADPVTRIVVEKLIRERNALKSEVNILKGQATVVVDRRPAGPPASHATTQRTQSAVEVITGPSLNQIEREALEHAMSPALWESEGWTEEKHGRVVKQVAGSTRSRTIFKPGFVTAVRKVLASR